MMAFRTAGKVFLNGSSTKMICGAGAKNFRRFSTVNPTHPNFPKEMITPEIEKPLTLGVASSKEILHNKIGLAVNKFQIHKSDTGSASVQIATMTERIRNLTIHFAKHKQDKHGGRGFQMLIQQRKRMMQYLMRKDIAEFGKVVQELGLGKEASKIRGR